MSALIPNPHQRKIHDSGMDTTKYRLTPPDLLAFPLLVVCIITWRKITINIVLSKCKIYSQYQIPKFHETLYNVKQ